MLPLHHEPCTLLPVTLLSRGHAAPVITEKDMLRLPDSLIVGRPTLRLETLSTTTTPAPPSATGGVATATNGGKYFGTSPTAASDRPIRRRTGRLGLVAGQSPGFRRYQSPLKISAPPPSHHVLSTLTPVHPTTPVHPCYPCSPWPRTSRKKGMLPTFLIRLHTTPLSRLKDDYPGPPSGPSGNSRRYKTEGKYFVHPPTARAPPYVLRPRTGPPPSRPLSQAPSYPGSMCPVHQEKVFSCFPDTPPHTPFESLSTSTPGPFGPSELGRVQDGGSSTLGTPVPQPQENAVLYTREKNMLLLIPKDSLGPTSGPSEGRDGYKTEGSIRTPLRPAKPSLLPDERLPPTVSTLNSFVSEFIPSEYQYRYPQLHSCNPVHHVPLNTEKRVFLLFRLSSTTRPHRPLGGSDGYKKEGNTSAPPRRPRPDPHLLRPQTATTPPSVRGAAPYTPPAPPLTPLSQHIMSLNQHIMP
ncbi:proteoglycan 4-like [Penaeus monodon]|uniref:proteoglycan 4-like n=1 Tax=Penaeus monodon TaxID=6687 RepID=UPI0018A6FC98|nr:proteoglycan 4-like [Penaeus monodon]